LPYTIYMDINQVPPSDEYDISKGYTYMYLDGEPLYPFGHGLSYSEFSYTNLQVSPEHMTGDGTLQIDVDVQNVGSWTGDEVVQAYVHYPASKVKRPTRQLVAFQRITLDPDGTKHVQLQVPAANLAFYDVSSGAFVVDPGGYSVDVGSSSADIRATASFVVK
jgi:beta-glucosidase